MFIINIKWLDEEFKCYQYYIEFVEIQGSYSRENLMYTVIIALKRIKSYYYLLIITGDNTSNNDTLCTNLYKLLFREYNDYFNKFPVYSKNIRFRGNLSYIQYFAYILNLIIKVILSDLSSSTYKQANEYLDRTAEAIAR